MWKGVFDSFQLNVFCPLGLFDFPLSNRRCISSPRFVFGCFKNTTIVTNRTWSLGFDTLLGPLPFLAHGHDLDLTNCVLVVSLTMARYCCICTMYTHSVAPMIKLFSIDQNVSHHCFYCLLLLLLFAHPKPEVSMAVSLRMFAFSTPFTLSASCHFFELVYTLPYSASPWRLQRAIIVSFVNFDLNMQVIIYRFPFQYRLLYHPRHNDCDSTSMFVIRNRLRCAKYNTTARNNSSSGSFYDHGLLR